MRFTVSTHALDRYRERVGPRNLSDREATKRIRLFVSTGRRATLRESRDILENVENVTRVKGGTALWHRTRGPFWFVISHGLVFTMTRDRYEIRGVAVITLWPLEENLQEGRKAA